MKKNKLIGLILILLGNTLLINARISTETLRFKPDSTVNRILILDNPKSTLHFYPKIAKEKVIYLRDCPLYLFCNANKNEYLLSSLHYGSVEYAFGHFEIGILQGSKNKVLETKYSHFETESGVKLGLSLKDLIKIKGRDYIKKENKVFYILKDTTFTYTKSPFLKRYNMPVYLFECTFEKDRIIKIRYGFENP